MPLPLVDPVAHIYKANISPCLQTDLRKDLDYEEMTASLTQSHHHGRPLTPLTSSMSEKSKNQDEILYCYFESYKANLDSEVGKHLYSISTCPAAHYWF